VEQFACGASDEDLGCPVVAVRAQGKQCCCGAFDLVDQGGGDEAVEETFACALAENERGLLEGDLGLVLEPVGNGCVVGCRSDRGREVDDRSGVEHGVRFREQGCLTTASKDASVPSTPTRTWLKTERAECAAPC
jgi:hypothetical protein